MSNVVQLHLQGISSNKVLWGIIHESSATVLAFASKVEQLQLQKSSIPEISSSEIEGDTLAYYIREILQGNAQAFFQYNQELVSLREEALKNGEQLEMHSMIKSDISQFLLFEDYIGKDTFVIRWQFTKLFNLIVELSENGDFSVGSWKNNIKYWILSRSLENTHIDMSIIFELLLSFQTYFLRAQLTVNNQSNAV